MERKNWIRRIVHQDPGEDRLVIKDFIPLAGICIGAGITLILLLLLRNPVFVFLNQFANTIILISAILGGGIAGALSKGGILVGLRAGLFSALLVCFLFFIALVVFFQGGNESSGFVILGFIGISAVSIVLYPIGGVIGAFLKSLMKG